MKYTQFTAKEEITLEVKEEHNSASELTNVEVKYNLMSS